MKKDELFKTPDAIYNFRKDGLTYYVIEDNPDDDYVRARFTYGVKSFPKRELQKGIENGTIDIGSESKLMDLKT